MYLRDSVLDPLRETSNLEDIKKIKEDQTGSTQWFKNDIYFLGP